MEFTKKKIVEGVVEQSFELTVAGEKVPGVIWLREGAKGPRPLILMGHGGSQHKKIAEMRTLAQTYARELYYAAVAIDLPGHGDRISREEAAAFAEQAGKMIRGGSQLDIKFAKSMVDRINRAVPEWKATLDAVQQLDFIGSDGPVGYWGISMSTAVGVPFVSTEPRIKCAVFGLAGLNREAMDFETSARAITIPIHYTIQWDDAIAPRQTCMALYEAFGSKEKSMHVNPGGHIDIPPHESASWKVFFERHLGK